MNVDAYVNWNHDGKYDTLHVTVSVSDPKEIRKAVWDEIKKKVNPELVISVQTMISN